MLDRADGYLREFGAERILVGGYGPRHAPFYLGLFGGCNLAGIPARRIQYAHIAGHYREPDGLRIDTHGEDVLPEVWGLLDQAYARYGVFPTLLERDFNIPPLADLLDEVDRIAALQHKWAEASGVDVA